jgi:alkylation response protein AidB-like acyl-CoA dehydrogenase
MALRAEAAWAQTIVAAMRLIGDASSHEALDDVSVEIAASTVLSVDAAIRNARDNVQNHGGVGYTAEHDAHRSVKRAHLFEHMLGGRRSAYPVLVERDQTW